PPVRVLKRETIAVGATGTMGDACVAPTVFGAPVIVGLVSWQTANVQLTVLFLSGLLFVGALLYSAALGLIRVTTAMRERSHSAFRYGLANLARRSNSSAIQL